MEAVRKISPSNLSKRAQQQSQEFIKQMIRLQFELPDIPEMAEITGRFQAYFGKWTALGDLVDPNVQISLNQGRKILTERATQDKQQIAKNRSLQHRQKKFKTRVTTLTHSLSRVSEMYKENLQLMENSISKKRGLKYQHDIKKLLEDSSRQPIKVTSSAPRFNLKLDRVRSSEDDLISNRSVFASNRSKISRNPSQPLSKRSAGPLSKRSAAKDFSVNGSVLTSGSNLLEMLGESWANKDQKEQLRFSMTKQQDAWDPEFDSFESSVAENMDVQKVIQALQVLQKAKLLDAENFLPKVSEILKMPDASANLSLLLQMIAMQEQNAPQTQEINQPMEMEPVMETINELAESTPITSLVTSPNKMKTEINRASEGPVIGHSLHDVRLEDILNSASITPLQKENILIENSYYALDHSKNDMSVPNNSNWFVKITDTELNSHELESKLNHLGSDCKSMIPRESIGTINSKSTADVSMCLRSKSFYRANSSGCSNLRFDS